MVVLDTVKLSFEFPDLSAVCVHLLTGTGPIFIDLVDDQCGVSVYHEAFYTELNGYTKSMETCFIFRGVVGSWKMNSEDVSELVLSRSNKQNVGASTVDVEGTVEIHYLVLGVNNRDGLLVLGPLSNEVSHRLQLNGRPAPKFNGISAKLDCPLDDAAVGLFVTEHVS